MKPLGWFGCISSLNGGISKQNVANVQGDQQAAWRRCCIFSKRQGLGEYVDSATTLRSLTESKAERARKEIMYSVVAPIRYA